MRLKSVLLAVWKHINIHLLSCLKTVMVWVNGSRITGHLVFEDYEVQN